MTAKPPDSRRALLALLLLTRREYVAARCRVSVPCVSRWASGRNAPSAKARRLLFSNYGIPIDGWRTAREAALEKLERRVSRRG